MKRKISIIALTIVLVMVLTFVLVACGGDKGEKDLEKFMFDQYNKMVKDNIPEGQTVSLADKVFTKNSTYISFDTDLYDNLNNGDYTNGLIMEINYMLIEEFLTEYMGFDPVIGEDMGATSAMDGVQTYEEKGYIVKWKYHPDNGLEGTIRVKNK